MCSRWSPAEFPHQSESRITAHTTQLARAQVPRYDDYLVVALARNALQLARYPPQAAEARSHAALARSLLLRQPTPAQAEVPSRTDAHHARDAARPIRRRGNGEGRERQEGHPLRHSRWRWESLPFVTNES